MKHNYIIMKTLKDHIIIYDDECPMCAIYTRAFVKNSLLEPTGREAYSKVFSETNYSLDTDRARNEIALINRTDGTILYGLDSLIHILSVRWPWMKKFVEYHRLYNLIVCLYKFISYNRKVIAPARAFERPGACTPDFHTGYRWAYIGVSWVITSCILTIYAIKLESYIHNGGVGFEILVCGGQILWQGLIAWRLNKERWLHYLGNMMTVSLGGALLLLPFLFTGMLLDTPWFYLISFLLVVGLMTLDHIRRVGLLGMPWILTVTWIAYRLLILTIVL